MNAPSRLLGLAGINGNFDAKSIYRLGNPWAQNFRRGMLAPGR